MFLQLKSRAVFASIVPILVFGFAGPTHAGSGREGGAHSPNHARTESVRGAFYARDYRHNQTRDAHPNNKVRVIHSAKARWLKPWPRDTRRVRPRVPIYADTANRHNRRADRPKASTHRSSRHKLRGYGDEDYWYLQRHDYRRYRHRPRTGVVFRNSGRHHDTSRRYPSARRRGHHRRGHHNNGSGVTIQLRF